MHILLRIFSEDVLLSKSWIERYQALVVKNVINFLKYEYTLQRNIKFYLFRYDMLKLSEKIIFFTGKYELYAHCHIDIILIMISNVYHLIVSLSLPKSLLMTSNHVCSSQFTITQIVNTVDN